MRIILSFNYHTCKHNYPTSKEEKQRNRVVLKVLRLRELTISVPPRDDFQTMPIEYTDTLMSNCQHKERCNYSFFCLSLF